jgi:hypothetical protein
MAEANLRRRALNCFERMILREFLLGVFALVFLACALVLGAMFFWPLVQISWRYWMGWG